MKKYGSTYAVGPLLALQLALSLLIPLCLLIVIGKKPALSALYGCLIAYVPTYIFAKKLFQYQGARSARQIVKSFYIGECLKIVSTILLFSLVFIYGDVEPLALFLSYIALLMTHWFAPLLINK